MAEVIVNALGMAISIFLFVFSRSFAAPTKPGVPSAAFFPTIIAVILFCLSIFNTAKYLGAKKKGLVEEPQKINRFKLIQFFFLVLLLVIYTVAWNYKIGHFIINTIIIFSPVCWLLSDETEWWKSVLFITGLTIFIYLLFVVGLKVRIW